MIEQNDRLYPNSDLEAGLAEWLPHQRWFAAKGHAITGVRVVLRQPLIEEAGFGADHLLVAITFDAASEHVYQVPLGYRSHLPDELTPWTIAAPDD